MPQGKSLSQRAASRSSSAAKSLEKTNIHLSNIKIDDLEELFRRDQIAVDSASSGSSPGFAISRKGSSSSSSPIERALMQKYTSRGDGPDVEKKIYDPVRDEVRKIERWIFEFENIGRKINESITFLKSTVEKERGHKPSPPCEACGILPITRRGACDECYDIWLDDGRPDFQRWCRYREALRNSEDGYSTRSEEV